MIQMRNRRIEVFENLNSVIEKYGKTYIPLNELNTLGVEHIFIRGGGYVRFSLIVDRKSLFDIINKNFTNIIQEYVEGYKGVYGYLGINPEFLESVKESKSVGNDEKIFTVSVDYDGPYYMINSGNYGGMVVITENFQNINFRVVKS